MTDRDGLEFIRARSAEQIDHRRAEIIQSARALLLDAGTPAEVTFKAIAEDSRLVKSNLYRYFKNREEIFITLLIAEAETFVDWVRANLAAIPRQNDLSACATVFVNACANNPCFCILVTALASTLEHNLAAEQIRAAKQRFAALMDDLAASFDAAAPVLGPEGSAAAISLMLRQLAGLWPHANPHPNVQAALQDDPALARFRPRFRESYSYACYAILTGIAHIGPPRRTSVDEDGNDGRSG